jgi:hypothetical protein
MDLMRMALDGEVKAHERYRAALAANQKLQFEEQFDELVKALEAFSTEYNRNRGQVWPAREAENLRKAMQKLQAIDNRLSAKR